MSWHTAPENDYRGVAQLPLRPEPTVTVVIPVYNRVELLRRTLSGLVATTYPMDLLEVVVADDGSSEDVAAATAGFEDPLRIRVEHQQHDGYGAGRARNMGARTATSDVLVFIDADCIPDPELVSRHVEWHRRADNLVVIGSRHHIDASDISIESLRSGAAGLRGKIDSDAAAEDPMAPDDFRRLFYKRTARLRTGDDAFRSLVSSNFSILREHFAAVGGFAEDFSRWGGEDTELGWRLFNAGLYFIPENDAAIYHQTQEDGGDSPHWRKIGRAENDGIIQAKIPHRFYRTSVQGYVYETPKVSWVVTPTIGFRAADLWQQIMKQSFTDSEVILLGGDSETDRLGEMLCGDPRVTVIPPSAGDEDQLLAAVRKARGEFVAIVHGWASLDHRLLGRAVRRLDGFPRASVIRCGYQVFDADGAVEYLYDDAIADIDSGWQPASLPVFALTRRREWAKVLRGGTDAISVWRHVSELSDVRFMRDAMVAVPGPTSSAPMPDRFPAITGERTHLVDDLVKGGPRRAAQALGKYAAAKTRHRPYKPVGLNLAPRQVTASDSNDDGPPGVTYVGWLGRSNYGDEVMFEATKGLLPDAIVAHNAPNRKMLMLGGGTLINRMTYLENLRRYDTPRVHRVVFGSGVADPDYWGQTEPISEWMNYLDRCSYVGVRGPRSETLLRAWGYTGQLEIMGDPGLSVARPDVERDTGLVVVSPAWTAGELWGSSDTEVFAGLAGMVRSLRSEGRQVAYLSCSPADDRHIMSIMKQSNSVDAGYVAAYDDLDAGTELLAQAGVVVAERLHAAVIAAACHTPFVAIEYRPKLRDFARSVGQQDLVVRSDEVTVDRLVSLVGEASEGVALPELKAAVDGYRTTQRTVATDLAKLLGE